MLSLKHFYEAAFVIRLTLQIKKLGMGVKVLSVGYPEWWVMYLIAIF